jgi:hypothetical protein
VFVWCLFSVCLVFDWCMFGVCLVFVLCLYVFVGVSWCCVMVRASWCSVGCMLLRCVGVVSCGVGLLCVVFGCVVAIH